MKYTLLEMAQTILSDMDSDEVNSISDTTESRQVAEIIRTTYYNIISRADLPEHKGMIELQGSLDPAQPTLMIRPDNVKRIDWIKYFDEEEDLDVYTYVTILPIEQYLDMTQAFTNTSDTSIGSLVLNGTTYYYKNDQQPRFCTILNNSNVLFNAYNNTIDTTLQSSKTMCAGQIVPTFDLVDSFIPDMDIQQFPLLLNEAKSLAFLELKQISNDSAVRESKRQWGTLQRTKDFGKPTPFQQLPSFGWK